jgi:DNA-binding PadR family transcriptional regulator
VLSLSSLDFLILVLAMHEDVTAYDLKSKADVSVAAALPALKRLENAGLVKMMLGSRRSRRYQLSTSGRRTLRRAGRTLDRPIPDDFESVIRVACVLTVLNPRRVSSFLKRAADQRRRIATNLAPSVRRAGILSAAERHRWMKEVAAVHRVKAEAVALDQLRKLLR